MTSSAYADRNIDIMAWDPDTTDQTMIDANSTGKIIAGIYKLGQRFLTVLLTEYDSVKYNYRGDTFAPGTLFMTELHAGRAATEHDLFSIFMLAELQARMILQSEDLTTDPDDERYDHATLESVTLSAGTATLTVKVYSKADSVTLILPLPMAV